MAVSTSETTDDEPADATIHNGPNGERGAMCFLSAKQLEQLGVSDDAEDITYYVDGGSLTVEE